VSARIARPDRRLLSIGLAVALVLLVCVYFPTFQSMADKWEDDAAFNYGYVIAPLSIWLAWRHRHWLGRVDFVPSWFGVLAVLAAALLWVVARGTGVIVVEQFAVVAMIPGLVLTFLGPRALRLLAFPLGFLVFLVPMGRALVPSLVDATADMSTLALQASGIPVYRTHSRIIIPAGWFEVARACSGVSFLLTAFVLGVLYAYLNYTRWSKRLVAVLLAVAVPVIANGIRVYITIAVSHLTDLRFGPGAEHVTFGKVFFIAVMLGMFWLGRRWPDPPAGEPGWLNDLGDRHCVARLPWARVVAPLAAVAALVLAPPYQGAVAASMITSVHAAPGSLRLPAVGTGWTGPDSSARTYRPLYTGGLDEVSARYTSAAGYVDVYGAVYGVGGTASAEMVAYGNVLYEGERELVPYVQPRHVDLGRRRLDVNEVVVPARESELLVWHWYLVGDRSARIPFAVKGLEALAWLTRGATLERVITLATPNDERARQRLQAFAEANHECLAGGLDPGACGP
jgi:exosortase A